jgi:hypothetical protein
MGVPVVLTPSEVLQAGVVGVLRNTTNKRDGRRDAHGCDGPGWDQHLEGAAAELAFAKAIGRFWSGNLGRLRAGDVCQYEIRSTPHAKGRLILHPEDPDERAFILVRGLAPYFEVAGWIMGRDGKQERFWCDPSGNGRPAYFVPGPALASLDTLLAEESA